MKQPNPFQSPATLPQRPGANLTLLRAAGGISMFCMAFWQFYEAAHLAARVRLGAADDILSHTAAADVASRPAVGFILTALGFLLVLPLLPAAGTRNRAPRSL